ncbi:hypothetical protein ACROYT_G004606, partial [Oculina patagonica]
STVTASCKIAYFKHFLPGGRSFRICYSSVSSSRKSVLTGPTWSKMWMLTFLLLYVVQSGLAAQCDRDVGPAGPAECVHLPRYGNQYQWATCVTNAYMQQQSGHKHVCVDRSATYCWYQCMLEVHGESWGSVTDDCSCELNNSTSSPYTVSPTTSLPPECYSPSGDSCNWYRNCLEKKYPCEATSNAYAIKYAETFCKLYDDRYSVLSEDAKKWVDGVRKCLQVALVPLMRPWNNPTCEEIRETALATHTPCYLNPGKDVPSICDLGYLQYWKIFWTIKLSFFVLDTAWESIKGFWNIAKTCKFTKDVKIDLYVNQKLYEVVTVMTFLKLKVETFTQRKRRTTDSLPEADVQSRFADRVVSAIAIDLNWRRAGVEWLAYNENQDIVLVLANIQVLGLLNPSGGSVNVNQTIQEFVSAVEKGTLRVQVDGNKVWIKSVAFCSNETCDDSRTLAVSKKPPWNIKGATGICHGTVALYGVIAVFVMLMDKLFF